VEVACLDLEGVLVPEVWIGVTETMGIEALRATTRDIPDYGQLMRQRLEILDQNGIGLSQIQAVIAEMGPLEGAREFLDWLRENYQVVILSDTFYQFATPLMRQLGWPFLLCHHLQTDGAGHITGWDLCVPGHKREAVRAFHGLNFKVIAVGDSFNDTGMLGEADTGIFFSAPENVTRDFPGFQTTQDYGALKTAFQEASRKLRES
jgi:phosphoserine/homoserine phosphotransferase